MRAPTAAPARSSAPQASLATSPRTGCVEYAELFQHPLIEEPPTSSAAASTRREYAGLVRRTQAVCGDCPLAQQCLFQAVVDYDVAGFCGGTTRKQRNEIRALLEVSVEPEDLDTLAGVQARHRQVDHSEVIRLRNANPHESLETLARRLGCSLSTVKRHLRKARGQEKVTEITRRPAPSVADVLRALRAITRSDPQRRAA